MTTAMGVTPEQYALGILRRHRDAMSRPDFQNIADDAALSVREVETLWEQLLAGRTPKPDYRAPGRVQTLTRPSATNAPPSPPAATVAPPAGAGEPPAWRAAADHPNAKVRRAAAKAVAAVEAVEQLLAAEAGKDELRKKEARLAARAGEGGLPRLRRRGGQPRGAPPAVREAQGRRPVIARESMSMDRTDMENEGVRLMLRHRDTASAVEAILDMAEPIFRADERERILAALDEQLHILQAQVEEFRKPAEYGSTFLNIDQVLAMIRAARIARGGTQ